MVQYSSGVAAFIADNIPANIPATEEIYQGLRSVVGGYERSKGHVTWYEVLDVEGRAVVFTPVFVRPDMSKSHNAHVPFNPPDEKGSAILKRLGAMFAPFGISVMRVPLPEPVVEVPLPFWIERRSFFDVAHTFCFQSELHEYADGFEKQVAELLAQ